MSFSICRHDSFGHQMSFFCLRNMFWDFVAGFHQGSIVVKEARGPNQVAELSTEKKREVWYTTSNCTSLWGNQLSTCNPSLIYLCITHFYLYVPFFSFIFPYVETWLIIINRGFEMPTLWWHLSLLNQSLLLDFSGKSPSIICYGNISHIYISDALG